MLPAAAPLILMRNHPNKYRGLKYKKRLFLIFHSKGYKVKTWKEYSIQFLKRNLGLKYVIQVGEVTEFSIDYTAAPGRFHPRSHWVSDNTALCRRCIIKHEVHIIWEQASKLFKVKMREIYCWVCKIRAKCCENGQNAQVLQPMRESWEPCLRVSWIF